MSELWRLRCPEGHCSWRPRGSSYWCEQCAEKFEELVDVKQETVA